MNTRSSSSSKLSAASRMLAVATGRRMLLERRSRADAYPKRTLRLSPKSLLAVLLVSDGYDENLAANGIIAGEKRRTSTARTSAAARAFRYTGSSPSTTALEVVSELQLQPVGEPNSSLFGRMEVIFGDARGVREPRRTADVCTEDRIDRRIICICGILRIIRQPRVVIVHHVRDVRVEDVEHVEREPHISMQLQRKLGAQIVDGGDFASPWVSSVRGPK